MWINLVHKYYVPTDTHFVYLQQTARLLSVNSPAAQVFFLLFPSPLCNVTVTEYATWIHPQHYQKISKRYLRISQSWRDDQWVYFLWYLHNGYFLSYSTLRKKTVLGLDSVHPSLLCCIHALSESGLCSFLSLPPRSSFPFHSSCRVTPSSDMRCECLIHPQHGHSCRYHKMLPSAQVHSHLCRMFLRPSMFLIYISLYCKWIVLYA